MLDKQPSQEGWEEGKKLPLQLQLGKKWLQLIIPGVLGPSPVIATLVLTAEGLFWHQAQTEVKGRSGQRAWHLILGEWMNEQMNEYNPISVTIYLFNLQGFVAPC